MLIVQCTGRPLPQVPVRKMCNVIFDAMKLLRSLRGVQVLAASLGSSEGHLEAVSTRKQG